MECFGTTARMHISIGSGTGSWSIFWLLNKETATHRAALPGICPNVRDYSDCSAGDNEQSSGFSADIMLECSGIHRNIDRPSLNECSPQARNLRT